MAKGKKLPMRYQTTFSLSASLRRGILVLPYRCHFNMSESDVL